METRLMEGNVSISIQALEQVFTDSVEAGSIEVGGLLVGYPLNGRIHITRAIPTSRGTFTRIPITSEDMARAADKLNRDERIVGWYHSHPGHTVFFSEDDIESHERFLQFNPRFQALVIDTYKAKRGDSIADCVRFYMVRDHRAVSIDDYGITGSSGKRSHDPRNYVFDECGFPYRPPLVPVGISAADDRGLRQALGAAVTERNELEEKYIRLRRHWKSNFHFSRKIFPILLISLILATGFLGFIVGIISSQTPEERFSFDILNNSLEPKDGSDIFTIEVKIDNYDNTMEIKSATIKSGAGTIFRFELQKPDESGVIKFQKEDLMDTQVQLLKTELCIMEIEIQIGEKTKMSDKKEFKANIHEESSREEISNKSISISEASFDWKTKELEIEANFIGFEPKNYQVLIHLWDPENKICKEIEKSIEISENNSNTIKELFSDGNSRNFGNYTYVDIRVILSDKIIIRAPQFPLSHIPSVEIKENPVRVSSDGSLVFKVVLYGPEVNTCPSFEVHIYCLATSQDTLLAEFDETRGTFDPISSDLVKEPEKEYESDTITISLNFSENYRNFLENRTLYVVVLINNEEIPSPKVGISFE